MGMQRGGACRNLAVRVGRSRPAMLFVAGLLATAASGALAGEAGGADGMPTERAEPAAPSQPAVPNATADGGQTAAPVLPDATFRASSDQMREPSPAASDARPSEAANSDPVMLRMLASEDVAVPIDKLNDALATTGSIAPGDSPNAPAEPPARQPLPAMATALLPAPPADAPRPVLAALSSATQPMPNGVPAAAERNFDASTVATATQEAPAGQVGHIVSSVNMRAKPDGSGRTVSVLASNTAVTVFGCKYWCEVEAAGQRGFVYKRFVQTH